MQLQSVTNPCQILVEQALEVACSASTKTQIAHMKGGGTATENNLHLSFLLHCYYILSSDGSSRGHGPLAGLCVLVRGCRDFALIFSCGAAFHRPVLHLYIHKCQPPRSKMREISLKNEREWTKMREIMRKCKSRHLSRLFDIVKHVYMCIT